VLPDLNDPSGPVSRRLCALAPADVGVSAVVMHERYSGAFDVLIADQARARELILVTRNMREFARLPGLKTENWQDSA
jgi:tRNA(fMet)-specific endonuclease VapC